MKQHLKKHKWKYGYSGLCTILVFLWLVKAPLMSFYISHKMKVSIDVGTISVWPKMTSIRTFRIMNPRGFKSPEAFKAKRAQIQYQLGRLFHTPSQIDAIILSDVDLNIELLNETGGHNWAIIGAKIAQKKATKEVIVHKLIINHLTAEITGKGAVALKVAGKFHFDQMEFDDIDSLDGFPTRQLASKIFQKVGLGKYLEEFMNPAERIQQPINPFDLF